MRGLRGCFASLLLMGALAVTRPIRAEDVGQLFVQGTAALEAGKHEDALRAFQAAWTLRKTHDVAANLAQAEAALGKHRDAAEHLSFALRTFPITGKLEIRKQMEAMLAEAKKEVVTLVVHVSVSKADVSVQGRAVGAAPIEEELFADAGTVTIEAGALGYEPAKQVLEAKKGTTKTVDLMMMPSADKPQLRSRLPILVLGGVALAGTAVGAGLLIGSRDEYDKTLGLGEEIRANNATCRAGAPAFDARCIAAADAANRSNNLKVGGVAAFSLAGAATVAAVAYWLWPSSASARNAVLVGPFVAAKTAGVVLSGRF